MKVEERKAIRRANANKPKSPFSQRTNINNNNKDLSAIHFIEEKSKQKKSSTEGYSV